MNYPHSTIFINMAVAHKQIDEVKKIILRYLNPAELQTLLLELSHTEAYAKNASFQETVNRLSK